MKPLHFFEQRSARWWALSVAVHIIVSIALAFVVFRYPLGQLSEIPRQELRPERLQFIALPTPPTEHSGGGRMSVPSPLATPARLRAPTSVPTAVPTPVPADSSRAQAAGATGAGRDVTGSGLATGIVPRQPDARIALVPGRITRVPRTTAEDVDSIVSLTIGIVRDSMAIAAGQRKPGDWTYKGKGGVWGWDQSGIRLGKVTIPQALLALLPLNVGSGHSPIEARSAAYIRRDVMENAQRAISEDEFRAAVKRIRERKERERRAKLLAENTKEKPNAQ